MKLKTSELTDAALDWAVELAKGTHWSGNGYFIFRYAGCGPNGHIDKNPQWRYSTDLSQGGPIIERERISVVPLHHDWEATLDLNEGDTMVQVNTGPTPLIAAMRCFVASRLGDTVEVPDELVL